MVPIQCRVSKAFHTDDDGVPFASSRSFGSIGAEMAGLRFDAEMLLRALRRIGLQADRENGGDHGITAAGPTVPPSAVQTVAEAT